MKRLNSFRIRGESPYEVLGSLQSSSRQRLVEWKTLLRHLSSAERQNFSSSPVCVSGEAGASHSTKEYLSFQLVRWIK